MIVTELKQGELVLPGAGDRPPGLHLSDIIGDLMKTLEPRRYGKPGGPDVPKVYAGLAFEEALERMFVPAIPGGWRPEPIFVEVPGTKRTVDGKVVPGVGGIWCSIDNLDPDTVPGKLVVREFKLTWYSANKPCPEDEVYWPWLVQIKGYCKAVGTTLAILTALHIVGNYAPPKPWPPRGWGLEFTPQEIEENWFMIVQHAKSKGWL